MRLRVSPLVEIKRVIAVTLALCAVAVGAVSCSTPEFIQRLPPGAQADNFTQVTLGKVDVLWVIDNSGSMADKQQNVHDNLATFFNYLLNAQVDFHVAVTTTDTTPGHAGQLVSINNAPKVITPSTPHALEEFQKNINVGTDGNANDKGLDGARLVLQFKPDDFLRDDAFLFIIFVSDDDDNSFPGDPKFFYRFFASQKGKGNDGMILSGGIVGPVPNGCFQANGGGKGQPATRFSAVVEMMNGITGSICDSNFSQTLSELGVQAVGLKRRFKLSRVPDLDRPMTVQVKYPCAIDDSIVAGACDGTPTATCTNGDGFKTCATLKKNPDATGAGSGWRFEKNTNSIVFDGTAIPPKGAAIEVVYFQVKA